MYFNNVAALALCTLLQTVAGITYYDARGRLLGGDVNKRDVVARALENAETGGHCAPFATTAFSKPYCKGVNQGSDNVYCGRHCSNLQNARSVLMSRLETTEPPCSAIEVTYFNRTECPDPHKVGSESLHPDPDDGKVCVNLEGPGSFSPYHDSAYFKCFADNHKTKKACQAC